MNTRLPRRFVKWAGLAMAVFLATLLIQTGTSEAGETKKFTLINVIFDGTKIWLPSSFLVNEGDEVEMTLINKLDEPHGFKIDQFGLETVIQAKSKTTVKFTATPAGIHPFYCHIHPPHIGGQIRVLTSKDDS